MPDKKATSGKHSLESLAIRIDSRCVTHVHTYTHKCVYKCICRRVRRKCRYRSEFVETLRDGCRQILDPPRILLLNYYAREGKRGRDPFILRVLNEPFVTDRTAALSYKPPPVISIHWNAAHPPSCRRI